MTETTFGLLTETDAVQGKAKYSAWEKEVKAGTTPEGAQQRYIAAVDKLKSDLGVSA